MTPLENDAKNFPEPATRDDLDHAIKGLKMDLTIILGGIMVAGISVIGVLVNV